MKNETQQTARPKLPPCKPKEFQLEQGFEQQFVEKKVPDEVQEEWWWWQQQQSYAEAVAPVPDREEAAGGSLEEADEPMEMDTDGEITESLDVLEAQITAEAERVQELERQLLADSDSDTEPEDGLETEAEEFEGHSERPAKVQKRAQHPQLRADFKELIHRYGASHSVLLSNPSTPPMEPESSDLGAPRTPPLWESPEIAAPILASLLGAPEAEAGTGPLRPSTVSDPLWAPPDPQEPQRAVRCAQEPQVVPLRSADASPTHRQAEWTAAGGSSTHVSTLEELVGHLAKNPVALCFC